jgi:O-antigen/teichoic acid export membrane protein
MIFKKNLEIHLRDNKKLLKNSLSLFGSQILKYSINIFISIWVTRYLGVELFGAFSYITALTGILGVFSALGMQNIIVRELVRKPENSPELLGTSITLSFFAGILTFCILVTVIIVFNNGSKLLLYLALINGFTFIFDTLRIFSFYFESKVESNIVARFANFSTIITSFLKLVCIYFDLGLYVLSSIYILDIAISGLLLTLFFSKRIYSVTRLSFSKVLAGKLLKDSFPLIMSGLMIGIFMKIDQIMINGMLGSKSSGIFAVAVRLTEIFYFIPVILQSTLFPGIIQAKADPYLFRQRMNNLYSISIIVSYCIIIVMIFSSSWVIHTLYGPAFMDARAPFMVSIWALLFVSFGISRNSFIIANNLTKIYMYITIIGAVLNIGFNIFLIPRYGIIGASISTIIAQTIAGFISGFFFKSLRADLFASYKLLVFPKINFKVLKNNN